MKSIIYWYLVVHVKYHQVMNSTTIFCFKTITWQKDEVQHICTLLQRISKT